MLHKVFVIIFVSILYQGVLLMEQDIELPTTSHYIVPVVCMESHITKTIYDVMH